MVQTVRVFSEDIRMEFGVNKCAILIMKRGKLTESEGIQLPNKEEIKSLGEGDTYKYLGVLEADDIKHQVMKKEIKEEYMYFRRIRRILKSKLNGGNTITAINSRAVSIIRYSAGIIKWTKEEIRAIDTKTRKLLTIYRALHPQADVDRLYIRRADGGRGMISVEDTVDLETVSLHKYVSQSAETFLQAVNNEQVLKAEGLVATKEDVQKERKERYQNKDLHGQFFRNTENARDNSSWQ